MRTRYQHGTIELKERARGPATWQFRWRDKTGKRMSEEIGTIVKYQTRSAVDRCSKVAYLRMKINSDQPAEPDEKFGAVLERYVQEEIPKRFSTQHAYLSYINNHIRPKWGECSLTEVKPLAVRDWLKSIQDKEGRRPLAGKTKGHIKGLMHRIFDCAMLWEYLPPDRNPMSLVRIEGSSKRRRKPRVLTPEEFAKLITALDREPCRTMVILALCTGVRCSELVALKWNDFDWENLSVYIRRAIVSGRVDDVKTEYSGSAAAARSSAGGGDFRVEAKNRILCGFGFCIRIAVHGRRETLHALEHAAQLSATGSGQSRRGTDWLAYASPHLPGVAGRQRRAPDGAEGTHAARIHSDHAEHLWRGDDGIDAGSARASGEAGNGALMDVSGRQRLNQVQ